MYATALLKLLQMSGQTHPLAALRAAELQKWAAGPVMPKSWLGTTRGAQTTRTLQ